MNNFLKDKNILVTGGTGFVGSHLAEELVRQKANVITTFLTTSPLSYFNTRGLDEKVTMVHADITDFYKTFDIVTKFNIDYILHLAAQAIVETAFYNPRRAIEVNVVGTTNVLESARLFPKIKGVIVASSDKAYGKIDHTPEVVFSKPHPRGEAKELSQHHLGGVATSGIKYNETDPLRGDHPYEVSKSSADLISTAYFKTYKLPVVITRFGNIYGEGDLNFSRIIPGIMDSIVRSKKLEVRSDGKYVRDYLYVKDVVNGYMLLVNSIEKVKGEAFNFGSDDTLSVLELIKLAEKILKKKIDYKILNIAKNEIPYQSLDYEKISKILNWRQKYSLKGALKKIYDWYKKVL